MHDIHTDVICSIINLKQNEITCAQEWVVVETVETCNALTQNV